MLKQVFLSSLFVGTLAFVSAQANTAEAWHPSHGCHSSYHRSAHYAPVYRSSYYASSPQYYSSGYGHRAYRHQPVHLHRHGDHYDVYPGTGASHYYRPRHSGISLSFGY